MNITQWNRPVPRYTSYPTAVQFGPMDEAVYRKRLEKLSGPLSLYIHIPFCRSMCLFCACSVVLNRKPERQRAYLERLLREIDLLPLQGKLSVTQLHLGGGTPTSLSDEEFALLMRKLEERFTLGGELSIEIDPRTVDLKRLEMLRGLGFNRVSFGVQDLDPVVQEAVRRRQSEEMTRQTLEWAREVGFDGINVDLIYGLPHQTVEGFSRTAEKILEMRPDRIALFSYAKVPWLKAHQKAIPEESLPLAEEKLQMYVEARQRWIEGGYIAIGMDHFSTPEDPLVQAFREGKLTRNFQGYSIDCAPNMIGLGMTAIGFIDGAYFQNGKTLEDYTAAIDQGHLPVQRGYILNEEDRLRRDVIQSLMCRFEVAKWPGFDEHFHKERAAIEQLKADGLIEEGESYLRATEMGRLFIRLVAAAFDAYVPSTGHSSAL